MNENVTNFPLPSFQGELCIVRGVVTMTEEIYDVYVVCTNCGKKKRLHLRKGLRVKDYLKRLEEKQKAVCPKCGCKTLKEMRYG